MRKQIIALVLIFSLVMPIIVQLGLLFQHKSSIRKSIEESFDKEELILFEFSHQEIKKLDWEHEREFKYQGNMYDVVQREQHGNKHFLWCYKDDKEKKLKEKSLIFWHLDLMMMCKKMTVRKNYPTISEDFIIS